MPLVDGFGRVHDDLRVSVTDRCNLRCAYCMPEAPVWFPRAEILRYEETERIVRIAAALGIRRIRLTGGERLVRRDLDRLVSMLAAVPGIDDLSLTTNGVLLGEWAGRLAAAGLRRVNVSLDTLDRERFRRVTGRDGLERTLAGLEAAERAGLAPLKINTVLLRGVNEEEIWPLIHFSAEHNLPLRLIELMPLTSRHVLTPEPSFHLWSVCPSCLNR